MEEYLQAFVNWEKNNQAKLLPVVEFANSNTKIVSTCYTLFILNYKYHPCVLFEDETDFHSKSRSAKELANEIRNPMCICQQNIFCIQE